MKASEIFAALEAGKVVLIDATKYKISSNDLWYHNGELWCSTFDFPFHDILNAKIANEYHIHESEFFAMLRDGCVLESENGLQYKAHGGFDIMIKWPGNQTEWSSCKLVVWVEPMKFRIVEPSE